MSKKKNFMDFVTANPPAFVPGQTLYWLDPETGEIRKCTNTRRYSIALTSNWEWKLIDPEDENFITVDEDPYYCTTKKRAKEFRDKLGILTYVVLEPAEDGTIVADDKRYKFFKQGTLDASTLLIRDTFFTRITKNDPEIKEGMRKKLIAGEDSAKMSYELATIVKNVPLEINPEKCTWSGFSGDGLYALLMRLGFRKFIERWNVQPTLEQIEQQQEEFVGVVTTVKLCNAADIDAGYARRGSPSG